MNLKKIIVTMAAALALYTETGGGAEAYKPMRGRTIQTYQQWRAKTNTPSKVERFFDEHLSYFHDESGIFINYLGQSRKVGSDFMQEPIDTYLRGGGDCEDFAGLAAEWLSSHGYETRIIGFFEYNEEVGHGICAVKEGNAWSYLGNDGYRRGYTSIEDLVEKNTWKWGMFREIIPDSNEERGRRNINTRYRDESQIKFWQ